MHPHKVAKHCAHSFQESPAECPALRPIVPAGGWIVGVGIARCVLLACHDLLRSRYEPRRHLGSLAECCQKPKAPPDDALARTWRARHTQYMSARAKPRLEAACG